MNIEDLKTTLGKATQNFINILPSESRNIDWDKLYPLDALLICRSPEDFDEMIDLWEKFLNGLDKFWNRLNAFAINLENRQKGESLMGYLGSINKDRITDELLIYLDKARNSSHHTLWKIIRPSINNEIITDAIGVSIDVSNGQLTISGKNEGTVSEIVILKPDTVLLQAVQVVENKVQKIYNLPESHLNNPLHTFDRVLPHMIGKFGLKYYQKVFEEFERRYNK